MASSNQTKNARGIVSRPVTFPVAISGALAAPGRGEKGKRLTAHRSRRAAED
jgi:hypothetical protein